MAQNLPAQTQPLAQKDLLSWHYSDGVTNFIKSKQNQLIAALAFFNFTGLLKNLFSPYRRMVAKEKTPLFDRISFNLTSAFVGFGTRIVLIFCGIIGLFLLVLLDIFLVIFYLAIPFFSLAAYSRYTKGYVFNSDLKNNATLIAKLKLTQMYKYLEIFFGDDLNHLFATLPDPQNLKISAGTPTQAITTILKNWPQLTNYLQTNKIKVGDFEMLIKNLDEHINSPAKLGSKPIGQALAFGYTNTLDRFSEDLTARFSPVSYIKKDILEKVEKTLARPQNNNLIIVGNPGVGRHTLVESVSGAIQRSLVPGLEGRRILFMDTVALLGSSKNMLEVRGNFEALLKEAKLAGNIILAIDQIDRMISAREGRVDLTEVVDAVLRDGKQPIIGITTPDEYNQFIRPNANITSLFERIDVDETTPTETVFVLIGKAIDIRQSKSVKTNFKAIIEIVEKSNILISESYQPEKSIRLLDDSVASALEQKMGQVTVALVDEIISQKTKTPVGVLAKGEAEKLKNLETILHKRIIGQDEAIVSISKAMRRSRAEIETGIRPIGSFLFLGPTGVGKTETAKALAEAYFGAENRMVRLDMPEFGSTDAIKRLIGDAQLRTAGQLATLVRENPFSLLLLDEFEKASRDVHNLFLQVFDEGFLTDSFGKKVSFNNVIIIATSNAGAEFIRQQVSTGERDLSKKLVDYVLKQGLFSPELINRFDATVVYKPLEEQQVVQVTALMLQELAKSLKETKNIGLEITQNLAALVAQKGFDPTFGARPIRRLIADKIGDGIAKMIIEEKVKNGQTIPARTLISFLS